MDRQEERKVELVSSEKKEIVQRPYQIECEQAIQKAGPGKHLVVLATGLGKTVVFTHLKGMGRTLILSHRDELVRQPEKYYSGRVTFGVEKAEEYAGNEEIVSASVLSLCQDNRLHRYSPDAFETIIVDEAHHCAAASYKKILNYFSGAKRVLGFTATPKRGDDVRLDEVFNDIIFSRDIRWGISNGYLSNIRCEQVYSSFSLVKVEKSNGDYNTAQLEEALLGDNADGTAIQTAARAYVERCHARNKHTLIYCVTKKICMILHETIVKMLPEEERDTVKVLLGDTPDKTRAQMLSEFSNGKAKCIINCMVLTEGTDLPICDAIINLRPTCRNTLYQQMVGRGTRLYPGKEYCVVFDIVPDDQSAVRRTLCTAPTLFGIDPQFLGEKQRKQLIEDMDLLSLCDQLSFHYAEKSAQMALLTQEVDLFLEEVEPVLERSKSQDVSVLVEEMNKMSDHKEADLDDEFGDLSVKTFADDQKKYLIKPNWNEEIWLSAPDALNRTLIRFPNISSYGGNRNVCGIGAWLPFQQAVNLAKMYCALQPDYYSYSWSKAAQERWKRSVATDAQRAKIRSSYKKQNIQISEDSQINKLDASRLIDLSVRYKDAVKDSDLLHAAASSKKTKKALNAKVVVEGALKTQKLWTQVSRPSDFSTFMSNIEKKYNEKIKERKESEAMIMSAEESITINLDMLPASDIVATDAQVRFVDSLRKDTGLFEDKSLDSITRRQASALISFLRRVKGMSYEFSKSMTFPDAWDVCMETENTGNKALMILVRRKAE